MSIDEKQAGTEIQRWERNGTDEMDSQHAPGGAVRLYEMQHRHGASGSRCNRGARMRPAELRRERHLR